MPRVKIDYIVSFSSEDPDNQASNLLAWDVNKKKWLCSKGESSCSVVLQLNKAVKDSFAESAWGSIIPLPVIQPPSSSVQTLLCSRLKGNASSEITVQKEIEHLISQGEERSPLPRRVILVQNFGWQRIVIGKRDAYHQICSVNIGAYQSALVEVLVGRSETSNEPFQVLVPSSVFQTPSEARRGAPGDADKVRSFGAETFASAGRDQRWDRLRVVCSQPYNKHCKFGLSFIHVFSEEDLPPAPAAPAPTRALAPARLSVPLEQQSSDEEEFRPGELFAKHLQKPKETPDTGAQIRRATSHALKNIPDSSIKLTKTPIAKTGDSERGGRATRPEDAHPDRHRDGLLYTADDERPNRRIDRVLDRHNETERDEQTNKRNDEHTSHGKRDSRGDTLASASGTARGTDDSSRAREGDGTRKRDRDRGDSARKKDYDTGEGKNNDGAGDNGRHVGKRQRSDKNRINEAGSSGAGAGGASCAPHALLADVVFVLSGYENPARARLRTAALALGARCEREWGPRCTHLICAFPGTPKLRAVRASAGGRGAAVVRGEWVEACARTRRRLPAAWFATEPQRLVPPPPGWDAPAHTDPPSECDTDDEIERVRQKMKKRRASPLPPAGAYPAREGGVTQVREGGVSPAREEGVSPAREGDVSVASADSDVTFVRDERLQGSVTLVESDSCGGSTDEAGSEDEEAGGGGGGARLPALFAGRRFAVRGRAARARLLERYLRAYGGLVAQDPDSEVDFVVCDDEDGCGDEGAGGGGGGGGAVRVRAAWLWRCHRERRVCAPHRYTLAHT